MKNIIWRAVAEVLRTLATAIIAMAGLTTTGCACLANFNF